MMKYKAGQRKFFPLSLVTVLLVCSLSGVLDSTAAGFVAAWILPSVNSRTRARTKITTTVTTKPKGTGKTRTKRKCTALQPTLASFNSRPSFFLFLSSPSTSSRSLDRESIDDDEDNDYQSYDYDNVLDGTERQRDARGAASIWEEDNEIPVNDDNFGDDDDDDEMDEGELAEGLEASDENDPLQDEYNSWYQALETCQAGLLKKETALEREMSKATQAESTFKRAQLLKTYLYMFPNDSGVTSATVQDWENDAEGAEIQLTLDPAYDSANAEVEALFQAFKKLKRGSNVVQDLLRETRQALVMLQEIQTDLQHFSSSSSSSQPQINESMFRLLQDKLLRSARMTGFTPPSETAGNKNNSQRKQQQRQQQQRQSKNTTNKKPPLGTPASNIRKLSCPTDCCTVLIGRNRRGNEYLSLNLARPQDVWMHARGIPGAHILLQPKERNRIFFTGRSTLLNNGEEDEDGKKRGRRGRQKRRFAQKREKGKSKGKQPQDGYDDDDFFDFDEDDDDFSDENDDNRNNDVACLQFAANLAVFYSDARAETKAPVTTAEPKHVLKPPNAPMGAVKLRKESTTLIGFPKDVPIEVVEAREQSGQEAFEYEYRAADKAKHRKNTATRTAKAKAKAANAKKQKQKQK